MIALDPQLFARAWIEAWNRRDIEGVLAYFCDDAVFSSPIARALGHGADGVVRGKTALRAYWKAALATNHDLRFELNAVHAGVEVLVLDYTTQHGTRRSEALIFDRGLVSRGYGTMPVSLT